MKPQDLYNWYHDHMTYTIIIILMAIESSIIPLPSEVVVPPAAYFALQPGSELDIFMVIVTATIGATLGAVINYVLSMIIGRPIIYGFANSKVGHMLMLSSEKMEKAENYFQQKGSISIFLGRLLPAVRHLISIPAGLSKMHMGKFVPYTLLGAALWNIVLAGMGYLLYLAVPDANGLFAELEHYNYYVKIVGYSLVALAVTYIIYKIRKNKNINKEADNL
ncbi:MAG: DedA family protein [Bacteroidales bacterium]|nr:DedA family protein [Candidatus Sodaliphilus aphodohippi]